MIRPTEAADLVRAELYKTEDEVIRDALRHLLRARPDMRIQLAAFRYRTEDLSLAKAAELAGVSWAQMKEILLEKGIPLRLGPESVEEAEEETKALRSFLTDR
jgi:predicted HTH domain antitoxin